MAKLRVTPEMVFQALFGGMTPPPNVQITGGWFNSTANIFEFELDGLDLPAASEVVAIVTVQRSTVEFKAA